MQIYERSIVSSLGLPRDDEASPDRELHDVFYVCHEADLTTGSSMSYDDIPSPSTTNESDTCLTIY